MLKSMGKEELLLTLVQQSAAALKQKSKEKRLKEWKQKSLHGKMLRETENVISVKSWRRNQKR